LRIPCTKPPDRGLFDSVAERYADSTAYVAAVRAAAAQMVAGRLLLPQDAERAIELSTPDRLSQLH
jgi:hypothetical protein